MEDEQDQDWWDDRVAALEELLGKSDGLVRHAVVPFQLGADAGGAADVIRFREHAPGIVFVTSELIGCDDQVQNSLGNYELAICLREDEDWGGQIISLLAYYTLEVELNPGETMDIGSALPAGSNIVAFLFCDYGQFEVRGRKTGVLMCVGITATELDACRSGRRIEVEVALRAADVFPFTDLHRQSVIWPE